MDRLLAMKAFTRVVETNSFTKAAATLDLARASVSVMIQGLERHLKIRLLQRTTRRLSLTTEGAAYYEQCLQILSSIDELESSFSRAAQAPRGRLRVEMPGALGKLFVMPRLAEFHELYPDIEVMVGFGDRLVDLIQEGVDCAIRIGALRDSSLVARRLGVHQAVTVASPAYLLKHGIPRSLQDLEQHVAVNYFWTATGRIMDFTFISDGNTTEVRMNGSIAVNDAHAYLHSTLDGFGIAQLSHFMAQPYLQTGELVEVLGGWKLAVMPISVIYPHGRHLSPTVRAFVDWIASVFARSEVFNPTNESTRSLVDNSRPLPSKRTLTLVPPDPSSAPQ